MIRASSIACMKKQGWKFNYNSRADISIFYLLLTITIALFFLKVTAQGSNRGRGYGWRWLPTIYKLKSVDPSPNIYGGNMSNDLITKIFAIIRRLMGILIDHGIEIDEETKKMIDEL